MKVVVAPNSFKGSLSATQAARAIGRGVLQALPDAQIVEIPVADGGDGTVEALVTAHHGTFQWVNVEGPLGDAVHASYGLIDGGKTAVIELASASGFDAHHRGAARPTQDVDVRIRSAARGRALGRREEGDRRHRRLGHQRRRRGHGAGPRLPPHSTRCGRDLPRGGAALLRLHHIDGAAVDPGWRAIEVLVACDVTNPLLGPQGASHVYGPQKGADDLDGRAARPGPGQLRHGGRARPRQAGRGRARRRRGRRRRGGPDRVPGRQARPRGAAGRANAPASIKR